jgi:hypothetical protein
VTNFSKDQPDKIRGLLEREWVLSLNAPPANRACWSWTAGSSDSKKWPNFTRIVQRCPVVRGTDGKDRNVCALCLHHLRVRPNALTDGDRPGQQVERNRSTAPGLAAMSSGAISPV